MASGILRFMCPLPSETAEHVLWLSGLYRTQKPAEMDQMWTKLVHAQPDSAHANQAASGQRPSMLNMAAVCASSSSRTSVRVEERADLDLRAV